MILNTTLADTDIRTLVQKELIRMPEALLKDTARLDALIQPSSLDLTLGQRAWLMEGSCRPTKEQTVKAVIDQFSKKELDLTKPEGQLLLKDSVYLIELQESCALTDEAMLVRANGKSSIGRVDVQVRLVANYNPHYDSIRGAYRGKLYVEVVPNSFHVVVGSGISLNQIRFSRGDAVMSDQELHPHLLAQSILYTKQGEPIARPQVLLHDGLVLAVDLNSDVVAYRAKKTGLELDLRLEKAHTLSDYFEVIERPRRKALTIERGFFYLLSTEERVVIPHILAGELAQVDPRVGNLTSHYAGFFDPAFGMSEREEVRGATTTLEVRVHNREEIIRDKQSICVLKMERISQIPEKVYGTKHASHYQGQTGVTPAKYFR